MFILLAEGSRHNKRRLLRFVLTCRNFATFNRYSELSNDRCLRGYKIFPHVPIWYDSCIYEDLRIYATKLYSTWVCFIFGVGFALSFQYLRQCEGLYKWNGKSASSTLFYVLYHKFNLSYWLITKRKMKDISPRLLMICRESKYANWYLASIFAITIFLQCCLFHYLAFHSILISSLWRNPLTFWSFYLPKMSIAVFVASFVFIFKRKNWKHSANQNYRNYIYKEFKTVSLVLIIVKVFIDLLVFTLWFLFAKEKADRICGLFFLSLLCGIYGLCGIVLWCFRDCTSLETR